MPLRQRATSPVNRGRIARAIVALGLALLGLVGAAGPASAAEIDCTPMGDKACRDLTPIVECVWIETDGRRTVVFGYDNQSTDTLRILPGNKNYLSPGPTDQGQPQVFEPGRQMNIFVATFPDATASWRLGNNAVSLTSSTPSCATKPVPLLGNVAAVALFLIFMAATLPASVRTRAAVPAFARSREPGR